MSMSTTASCLVKFVPRSTARLMEKKLLRLTNRRNAPECANGRCCHTASTMNRTPSSVLLSRGSLDVNVRASSTTANNPTTFPGTLSKQQARDLAVRLTSDERDVLISALQESQSAKTKAEFEGQLAAFRWRSKFGRPSRVASLGDVDPTGTYCAVPEDWLLRKYVATVPQPTKNDLFRVSITNAIPFIGFGFLDNFFMIIAGDQIESSLGAVISLSTMAAAAFGNTISDILGIGSAVYVERFVQKIGFKAPKLTPIQMDLPKSRTAANLGRVLGVTIGCLLGMTPLLVLHKGGKDKEAKEQEHENVAV